MQTGASELAWLWEHAGAWALVTGRVAGACWTAPALAAPGLGARVRLLLAVLLAAVLAPALAPELSAPVEAIGLARAVLAEVLAGAVLGWSAALVVAGARQAGELVGAQAGLSPAALFDPEAGDEMTPLGHLYGLVALAAFLALDGPLRLVQSMAESYRVLPAGGMSLSEESVRLLFGRVGEALELALRAAAPPALALALAGVALGLLGRAAPSLPLLALSLPVRTLLGLALVVVGLVALGTFLSSAWSAVLW
ncbi:MAG: flagellar biosynthetic protein FliR [Isosphaeraceae bacterium]|nr:flagellar biosynthetic protein FliR [Isosphaeraceae bacterium]